MNREGYMYSLCMYLLFTYVGQKEKEWHGGKCAKNRGSEYLSYKGSTFALDILNAPAASP